MVRAIKDKKKLIIYYVIIGITFVFLFFSFLAAAGNFAGNDQANLTINDTTDFIGQSQRYTYCNEYCANKIKSSYNSFSFTFYANFTNFSDVINSSNGEGMCEIRFNETGTYTNFTNMSYNFINYRFEYNRTFNYKGNFNYQINCSSTYGNITLNDSYLVTNTNPYILSSASGQIDFDGDGVDPGTLECTEDIPCYYYFNTNVSEDDLNDVLTYGNVTNLNTTLTNFSLNSSTGLMIINITRNAETGLKFVELSVDDDTPGNLISAILSVNINSVNDLPYFVNLIDRNMTWTSNFDYIINVSDEEEDSPYTFNISFLSCNVIEWSNRNCSDSIGMQLFNYSNYFLNQTSGFINISFDPDRNDVGNYTINFTVTDAGNASYSKIVNFEVLNVNSPPNVTYICNAERNTSEDSQFSCFANVSDNDEIYNLSMRVINLDQLSNNFFMFDGGIVSDYRIVNISTGYNATFLFNFTTNDSSVGNWSLMVNTTDSEGAENLSYFYFYVSNVDDNVILNRINMSGVLYTTSIIENYYINASDDDLLISSVQKSIYNETLIFNSNDSIVRFNSSIFVQGNNYSTALFSIYPNSSGAEGLHNVNISVVDYNGFSSDSFILLVNISSNHKPDWNSTFSSNTSYVLIEDTGFYLNLSANVSDSDVGDIIIFNYTINDLSNASFPSFVAGFNSNTGIINFTPGDLDVGYHNITINAIDQGKNSVASLNFIFRVNNVADNLSLKYLSCTGCNPTGNINGNVTLYEDNLTSFTLYVYDNDFRIQDSQASSFYNETITVRLNISGRNTRLFNFTSPFISDNESQFSRSFTSNKSDTGNYSVIINMSDNSNRSTIFSFNISILEIPHNPVIVNITDSNLSIYENFTYDVNSSDLEDGGEISGNLTYTLTNLTADGNFLIINSSTGIITNLTNFTGKGGIWNYSVSVFDSENLSNSDDFLLYIFDEPSLISDFSNFSMFENVSYEFNISANHSVGTDLTYKLYINDVIRQTNSGYGDSRAVYIDFIPNFSDETTCSGISNLTLNISNQKLSRIYYANLSVNHTNYPLAWKSINIGGNDQILEDSNLDLEDYFIDLDASDGCTNQTIGFKLHNSSSQGSLSFTVANWTNSTNPFVNFSGTGNVNYSIVAFEYNDSEYNTSLRNISSNNFSVSLAAEVIPDPTPTPTPSDGGGNGGGGGGSDLVYETISLNIIVPGSVSLNNKEKIILPVTLENDGKQNLNNVTLSATVVLDGNISKDIFVNLSLYHLDSLKIGEKVNLTLSANADVKRVGIYEITIFANVSKPVYSDTSKIYINIKEESYFYDRVIFTEELFTSNPECAEIQEIVDDAKDDYENGKVGEAERKIEIAISSCKEAIAQKSTPVIKNVLKNFGISNNILLSIVFVFFIALIYHFYRRFMFSRKIRIEDDI